MVLLTCRNGTAILQSNASASMELDTFVKLLSSKDLIADEVVIFKAVVR